MRPPGSLSWLRRSLEWPVWLQGVMQAKSRARTSPAARLCPFCPSFCPLLPPFCGIWKGEIPTRQGAPTSLTGARRSFAVIRRPRVFALGRGANQSQNKDAEMRFQIQPAAGPPVGRRCDRWKQVARHPCSGPHWKFPERVLLALGARCLLRALTQAPPSTC